MTDRSAFTWAAVHEPSDYDGRSPMQTFTGSITLRGDFNCWVWTGRQSHGYGSIQLGRKSLPVHVFSYTLHRDDIPAGLTLDHLCRIPLCCNPWHLEPVTRKINTRRMLGFRRHTLSEARSMKRA